MPNNNEPNDTQAVFIQLVSEAIKETSGLAVKVDNIARVQERQDVKLDGLSTTLTEIKTMNGHLTQRVETAEGRITDHETRIRFLEPVVSTVSSNTKRIEAVEGQNEAQQNQILEIKNQLIRYGAAVAVVVFALQIVVTAYVIPWLQQIAVK